MNNPLPDSSELSGVLFAAPYQCKDSDLSRNGRKSLTKAPCLEDEMVISPVSSSNKDLNEDEIGAGRLFSDTGNR